MLINQTFNLCYENDFTGKAFNMRNVCCNETVRKSVMCSKTSQKESMSKLIENSLTKSL
tara:strand:+ start:3922 stop:4098 length:177 start_codon:yes stop_codon:yes gene_type:complete